ncbi:MAG: hypothetical protein OXT07_13260 [bacterium]|nr:hypothetical protein [bacterium]
MTLLHNWLSAIARFVTQPSYARRVVFAAACSGVIVLLRLIGVPS